MLNVPILPSGRKAFPGSGRSKKDAKLNASKALLVHLHRVGFDPMTGDMMSTQVNNNEIADGHSFADQIGQLVTAKYQVRHMPLIRTLEFRICRGLHLRVGTVWLNHVLQAPRNVRNRDDSRRRRSVIGKSHLRQLGHQVC